MVQRPYQSFHCWNPCLRSIHFREFYRLNETDITILFHFWISKNDSPILIRQFLVYVHLYKTMLIIVFLSEDKTRFTVCIKSVICWGNDTYYYHFKVHFTFVILRTLCNNFLTILKSLLLNKTYQKVYKINPVSLLHAQTETCISFNSFVLSNLRSMGTIN